MARYVGGGVKKWLLLEFLVAIGSLQMSNYITTLPKLQLQVKIGQLKLIKNQRKYDNITSKLKI